MVTKSNYVSDVISSLLLSCAEWVAVLCERLSKRFRVSKASGPTLSNLLPLYLNSFLRDVILAHYFTSILELLLLLTMYSERIQSLFFLLFSLPFSGLVYTLQIKDKPFLLLFCLLLLE